MKRIIKQSATWLAPAVLAAAALLACNDDSATETQTAAPTEAQTITDCSGLGSADAFVPGSRHMPRC